jgi:beta-1,4-N-acetylglucosaminyltransferase
MKVALAASSGGHFAQLLQLEPWYKKHEHFFVTFYTPHLDDFKDRHKVYFITEPRRKPLLFIKNIIQSLLIMAKESPDAVITTGAGVAIPLCYWAKLLGKKIIYIESFSRIHIPSLTGKILYPISDLFIVQWKELLRFFPKAKYGGMIF